MNESFVPLLNDSYFCRIVDAQICFISFSFLFDIPLFLIFFIEIDASSDIAWSRRCPSFDIHIIVINNHSTRDATTLPTRRCFVKQCTIIIVVVVVVVVVRSSIGISGSVLTLKRFRIGKGNSSQTWSIAASGRSTFAFRHRLLPFLFGSHNGRCR